jgi:putative oxidoreductase
MKSVFKILRFDFLPTGPSCGLLALRLWLGLSLLLLHGWTKLSNYSNMSTQFPDPLGVGSHASLGMAVFAEAVCAALLAIGLFTRFAALVLAINMGVAFFMVHKAVLKMGPGSGELAFIYLAGFVAIFLAGPGRFSIDARSNKGAAAA